MGGQLGQFVFTLARAKTGQYVVINRGWIEPGTTTAVENMNATFNGQIAPWPKPGFQLGEQELSDRSDANGDLFGS